MEGAKPPERLVLLGKDAESFCMVMKMLRCGYDVVLCSDLRNDAMSIKIKKQKPVGKIQISARLR